MSLEDRDTVPAPPVESTNPMAELRRTIDEAREQLGLYGSVVRAAKAFREAWLLEHDTEERRQMALLLEAVEALEREEEAAEGE